MKNRKEKSPSVIEPPKKLLVISQAANSPKTKPISDMFCCLKRESMKYVDKDGECIPSSDNTNSANGKLEEQMKRLNASLFVYINVVKDNKIRIIMGRTHEYQIIDVAHFDFVHEDALGMMEIESTSLALVVMNGRCESPRVQNLLLDVFRESLPGAVSINMCTRAYTITVLENNRIEVDVMKIQHTPFSVVPIMSPLVMTLISSYHCSDITFGQSKRIIRQTEKKVKNVEKGPLSSTMGVIHIERQDLSEVRLSKGKALRNN